MSQLTTIEAVKHAPCPKCTSSDGFSVNPDTGWGKCFVCDYNQPPVGKDNDVNRRLANSKSVSVASDGSSSGKIHSPITPVTNVFRAIEHRALPKAAVEKYKIDVVLNDGKIEARYPYFKNGVHTGNKVRTKDKQFFTEGNVNDGELFGQNLFPPGSAKAITVVEGEYDAPSAWVLTGSRYPVVSVCNASTALADAKRNFEYLDSFPTIVVCLDTDTAKKRADGTVFFPGQEAAKSIAALFSPGKVRVCSLALAKDPNEYLVKGKSAEFIKEWYSAPKYTPDGLKIGTDIWEEIVNRPKHFQVDYPFSGLNRLTYGLRLSEMVVITAETGIGKTSVLKEIEYTLLMHPELKDKQYGVGFLHLEEPNYDTALGLMSIHANKPFHLPDTERTTEELRSAYDAVINSERVVIWDHFGSNAVDAVLDKIRHMAALGCKYIVLDHLSIVVSDQSGDERKQLDEISTKAKTLCMNLNIALICVIHQNRAGQIRGTAGVEQLANIVIKLYRSNTDVNEWRRNVTKVVVEKNRFCGRTGPACYLYYNGITGRLEELGPEEAETYEQGEAVRDDQVAF